MAINYNPGNWVFPTEDANSPGGTLSPESVSLRREPASYSDLDNLGGNTARSSAELTWDKITDRVKAMLGYPVVSVYTPDESIDQFKDDAFTQFASSVFQNQTLALPPLPVQKLPTAEVPFIYNVEPYGVRSGQNMVYFRDEFTLTEAINFWNLQSNNLLLPLLAAQNYNQIANVMGRKFDWSYDTVTGTLYVTMCPAGTQVLSVRAKCMYTKDTLTRNALQWIYRMTLALTKISEGRIRSKYADGGTGVVSDGATLLQEGQEEYKDLIEKLDGFISLDYGIRR